MRNVPKLVKIIYIKCWSPGSGRSSCFTNFEKLINGAEQVQLLTKGSILLPLQTQMTFYPPPPHHLHSFSGKHCPKIVPTSARMSSWRSIWETGTPKYSDTKLVDTCSRDRDTRNIRKLFITAATAVQKRVKFCEFWSPYIVLQLWKVNESFQNFRILRTLSLKYLSHEKSLQPVEQLNIKSKVKETSFYRLPSQD